MVYTFLMPWNEQDKMSLKEEFIHFATQPGANKRELMRRFNISAPTGYKWLKRYHQRGLSGLTDLSRRPHSHPARTSFEAESAIVALREQYPYWGARKLRQILLSRGVAGVPSATTVHAILKRRGLLDASSTGTLSPQRFERAHANELWQMDFKGHFGLVDGGRCHPLTICDDHSRYNLLLHACGDERTQTVQELLQVCFEHYGLPVALLCDNASPWGCSGSGAIATQLELWLIRVGVKLYHGRPYHPQTQGKQERFHATLKKEVLKQTTAWKDLPHCQKRFTSWRVEYNTLRPHEALQMRCPIERYRPSERSMPSEIPQAESFYLRDDVLRKVKGKGEITFKNQSFYIGQGFAGQTVALRPNGQDQWKVFYCWKSLGAIDLSKVTKSKHQYEKLIKEKSN